MRKTLLLLLPAYLILVHAVQAFSQNDEKSTLIGNTGSREFGISICANVAGNKYIAGESDQKGLIVKQDVLNTVLWSKTFNYTTDPADYVSIGFLDVVGDTVFGCGKVYAPVTGVGKGSFYFKMNAQTGALYWSKFEAGVNYFSCMRYANGKFFLIGGNYAGNSNYGGRVMAVSSQTGQVIWQNTGIYGFATTSNANQRTTFVSATEMVNGKMFLTGSAGNLAQLWTHPILIGINENGTIFLQKYLNIPGTTFGADEYIGHRIEYDQNQNLVLLISDNILNLTLDPVFVKCDQQGNLLFAKRYGSATTKKFFTAINETATHYVLYGLDITAGQKLFALKVFKNGVLDKGVSIYKPNVYYYMPLALNYFSGNSAFLNGLHYFITSESPTTAFEMDINQIIMDEDLNVVGDCSLTPDLPWAASDIPVTVTQLGITIIPSPLTFANNVVIQDLPLTEPCTGVSLDLVQNTGCQMVLTANVAGFTNPSFYWSNGTSDTSNTSAVNTTDTVIVRVVDIKCCERIDTIVPVMATSSFTVNLPPDTTICLQTGNSFTIVPSFSGANSAVTYLWSNNSTGPSLSVNQSGTYWVDISDNCFTRRDSMVVTVNSLPAISLTGNGAVCEGNFPVTLNPVVSAGSTVMWEDGTTAVIRTVNGPGTYTITATNSCGTSNAVISITQINLPDVSLASSVDTCVPIGGNITLIPSLTSATNLLWSDGSTGNQLSVSSSGIYTVYASNSCGTDSAVVSVTLNFLPAIGNTANVSVCEGNFPVVLNPTVSVGASVLWDDGTTAVSRSVNTAGNYTISATNSCGTVNAVIAVTQTDLPTVQLVDSLDTCIQSGNSVTLIPVTTNAAVISWSDGSTGNQLAVSTSGIYTVYASNSCGIDSASCLAMINYFPELDLPATLDTCFEIGVGFSYTVQGSPGSYQWSSGSQTATEWISQEGIYSCTLTNSCGTITDSMQVRRFSEIDLHFPEDSIKVCERQLPVSLLHVETNYTVEIFAPGGGLVGSHLFESGWYQVRGFNACNEKWDSIYVNLQNEQFFYLPNSFTPNADGHNDRFEFKGENILIRDVRIFNRWGEEIFTKSGTFTGWDGTYRGEICPDGIYAISLIYEDCFGMPTVFKGHVNLVR